MAGKPQPSSSDIWTAWGERIEQLVRGALVNQSGPSGPAILFDEMMSELRSTYNLTIEEAGIDTLVLPTWVDFHVRKFLVRKRTELWASLKELVTSRVEQLPLPPVAEEFRSYYTGFFVKRASEWFFTQRPEVWPAKEISARLTGAISSVEIANGVSLLNNQEELRDEELVRLLRAGHTKCRTMLLERYAMKLHDLAPRIIYAKNLCPSIEDPNKFAEDVAQEVLVSLLEKLDSFRLESSFETWVGKIVENEAKSIGLREQLGRSKAGPRIYVSFEDLEKELASPIISIIEDRERRKIVRKALNKHRTGGVKDSKSTDAIELRYFDELPTPEIAKRLDTTELYVGRLISDDYPKVLRILNDDFGITGTQL